jgi:hypothetical protein
LFEFRTLGQSERSTVGGAMDEATGLYSIANFTFVLAGDSATSTRLFRYASPCVYTIHTIHSVHGSLGMLVVCIVYALYSIRVPGSFGIYSPI